MNNEAPDSPQAAPLDAKPARPVDELRALLDAPKPKLASWQSDAGRAVSMIAVGFLNEADDVAALRSVALLGLAQSLGVKEARKRAIKLTRWAKSAPPPLTTLALKDEQQAAFTAIAKLKSAWSRSYAEQALADPALPEEFLADLLKSARATYGDNLSFIQEFYAPHLGAVKVGTRGAAFLKEGVKLLKPSAPENAARLAEGTAALVEASIQMSQRAAADDKAFGSGIAALLHLVQETVAAAPAVLLQPPFVMAVGRLSRAISKGPVSKQVTVVANALAHATASLLTADVERYGSQAAIHWRPMVPTWRSAYANWDACIAAASKLSPALAAITAEPNEEVQLTSNSYDAEAVFARLLPAWDAFVADLPDPTRAASLTSMLSRAANTAGVETFGIVGETVGYDPLSHHLAGGSDAITGRVRILRAGVRVKRPDGSTRTLVPALVEVA
jgi:hypothetical protein